jgi:hypothetical protein
MGFMTHRTSARRLALALLLSLGCVGPLLQAQMPAAPSNEAAEPPPRYLVEVLVFRTTGNVGAGEILTAGNPASLGEFPRGSAATPEALPGEVIEVLPANRRRLGGASGRLTKDGAYRVVAHQAWIQTASPYNSGLALPLAKVGLAQSGLNGQVLVERGQYLHLGMALTLDAPQGGRYALQETRRVRTGERHYFDHPAFGVIATVTSLNSGN